MSNQSKAVIQKKVNEMVESNSKLSPIQKLAKLDKRLGVGVGAVKERRRLDAEIEDAKNQAPKKEKKVKEESVTRGKWNPLEQMPY